MTPDSWNLSSRYFNSRIGETMVTIPGDDLMKFSRNSAAGHANARAFFRSRTSRQRLRIRCALPKHYRKSSDHSLHKPEAIKQLVPERWQTALSTCPTYLLDGSLNLVIDYNNNGEVMPSGHETTLANKYSTILLYTVDELSKA
ncbi:hypothetical protein WAI453_000536 [Rhynchosporium graminicola]